MNIKDYLLITKYLILNEKFLISIFFYIFAYLLTKNKNIFLYGLSIILIYTTTLYIVYLSTPLDIEWHLDSSATRVVKPMALFLFVFGMYNINNKNKIY